MNPRRGNTKIVCTIGPATASPDVLEQLIVEGMDVARLNFSHGTREEHAQTVALVREASRRTGVPVAVLQDLQGPKIRVGSIPEGPVKLRSGAAFTITTADVQGTEQCVSTTYDHLPDDVRPGSRLLLDDGRIELRVKAVEGREVHTEVRRGGMLSSHKGINLPGVAVSAPSPTPKDRDDLAFGLSLGVDAVALSFVRSPDDLRQLRATAESLRGQAPLPPMIAKIEKPEAVRAIDAIIAEADGVMVARGDLGVELPNEEVPVLQKAMIRKCNEAGKPVIIATQMLESMVREPSPTRAETSDVANAVFDSVDAVMLSGETSVGAYPVEAARMMSRIVGVVEAQPFDKRRIFERTFGLASDRHDALARAACVLAEQLGAAAIVAVTHSGRTARVLARYRPAQPIVAITDEDHTLRALSLVWGVRGFVFGEARTDSDATLRRVQERVVEKGYAHSGQYVILLAGQPLFTEVSTNFVKVERVP